jgi:Fic family protein
MSDPRHSRAEDAELISNQEERARREASNALAQTSQVQEIIAQHVVDGRPFRLRPLTILALHRTALEGISAYAGTWRPAGIEIGKSSHVPPAAHRVPELVEQMCDYVNDQWGSVTPVHLCAFVMWRLNWIHPFTDGNGRTSRAVAYLVLSVATRMLLPGAKTIPEQIIANRNPYYGALEEADKAAEQGQVDVSELEKMLEAMLAAQLLSVAELATGNSR